jgi:hypothetical protein
MIIYIRNGQTVYGLLSGYLEQQFSSPSGPLWAPSPELLTGGTVWITSFAVLVTSQMVLKLPVLDHTLRTTNLNGYWKSQERQTPASLSYFSWDVVTMMKEIGLGRDCNIEQADRSHL